LDNLEWCENRYNINYGTRTERASSHLRKPVVQYDKFRRVVNKFHSQAEAYRQNGCRQQDISKVCLGQRTYCGGFGWGYDL